MIETLLRKVFSANLLEREQQMTTYLGDGVCLPHARVKMKRPYMIAVGRCPDGVIYEGNNVYKQVRYIFLLLASKNARGYLYSLASLARVFQDASHMNRLAAASALPEFRRVLSWSLRERRASRVSAQSF